MESHSSSTYNSLQNIISEISLIHHIKNDITGTCADLVYTGSDEETYSRAGSGSGSENSLTMNDSSSTETDDHTDDHEEHEYAAAEDKERPQTQFFTESYIIYNVPYLYCIFSNVIY